MSNSQPDSAAAREGYRAALQMIAHEGKVAWDSFRSVLAANAVLIALAGATIQLYPTTKSLAAILGVLGVVTCIAWALITARSYGYYKYWFAWARRYERDALGSEDQMIQRGARFSAGIPVSIDGSEQRFSWFARLFRVQWLTYVIILAFLVVHIYVIRGVA